MSSREGFNNRLKLATLADHPGGSKVNGLEGSKYNDRKTGQEAVFQPGDNECVNYSGDNENGERGKVRQREIHGTQ